MRYLLNVLINRIWMFITLFVLMACAEDSSFVNEPLEPNVDKQEVYFSVDICLPANTRATKSPTGGEEGDGTLDGSLAENKISNLTVFFYQGTNLNAAVAANATIVEAVYFHSGDIQVSASTMSYQYTTTVRKLNIEAGTYRMIAVANMGSELATSYQKGSSLKELCDGIAAQAWTVADNVCTQFVMSSKTEASVTLSADNDKLTPATASVQLTRLAARIDILPNNRGNQYEVNSLGTAIGSVTIKSVKLVNRFVGGSYLIKRVATNAQFTSPTYLGNEELNPKNYVLDPWTDSKKAENLITYADKYLTDASYTTMPAANLTLGYTLENTIGSEQQLNGYSTGVMYETIYIPNTVIDENGVPVGNSSAITFFAYNKVIYKDAIAVTKVTGIAEANFEAKGVKKYTNGICYYPYWIRHSYNNGMEMGVMEFAIVRNNVYQLQVNSFSGLGEPSDKVDPTVPDKESYVRIRTTVRPWNVISHPEIIM